jgi:hypothetical protein
VLTLILELATTVASEFLWEGGFQVLKRDHGRHLRRYPVLGVLGALLLGVLFAAVVTTIFPRRLMPAMAFAGASLVVSPLVGGFLMHAYARWASAVGRRTSFLASGLGGASFALGFASARLAFLVFVVGAT